MTTLTFPCIIFKTQKRMDDYAASDMRYGDLTENCLKNTFNLVDVSTRVDPYTLTSLTSFNQPQSMFHGSHRPGEKMSSQECARILFDEFRHLAQAFAFFSPYRQLIEQMITHMQQNNGEPFYSLDLNSALRQHIIDDSTDSSTLKKLKSVLAENIDWENGYYPSELKYKLYDGVMDSRLPKFDRIQDNFNGMGITVHDTWATHITLQSLRIENNHYRARVRYQVQDHFGLDDNDVCHFVFSQFRLFRIWFVLQRYHRFSFKPFMTNMNADIEITGVRNANK